MKLNKKSHIMDKTGYSKLRVWYSKPKKRSRGTVPPSYNVKCGCCEYKVEISDFGDGLEINGVFASKKEWSELLKPLLKERFK